MAGIKDILKNFLRDDEEIEVYEDERHRMQEEEHEEPIVRMPRRVENTNVNKVVNIHATAQLQVVLSKPESFGDETRAVADELIEMHTVVLNLENTNKDVSRRTIDFLSGVAYANGGKIKRVATSTYIITPYNVDLTGDDVLDELENSGVYF
jgi:cell division inhibitor SepF